MRVGFIGLGLMGEPMARNVMKAGHDLTVWSRDPSTIEDLVSDGAESVPSPSEVGVDVDVICTCLPNGEIVREVLLGADGALTDAPPGLVVVDHSTISQADAKRLSSDCDARGFKFIDAPISGGPERAASGTLAVFVGGSAAAIERARPVIDSYGSAVVHLGESGSGQAAKLANQMIIACTVLGIAEAFAYAQAEGVDPTRLMEILQAATADSVMLQTRIPVPGLQPGMPASNDWQPGFTADFMAKDLRFAVDGASAKGLSCDGLALVADLLERVREDGRGSDDWTVFSQYLGSRFRDD